MLFTVAARIADTVLVLPYHFSTIIFNIKRGGRDFRAACLHFFGSCMKEKEKS